MEDLLKKLMNSRIFSGLTGADIIGLFRNQEYLVKHFSDGESIFEPESCYKFCALILAGNADVIHAESDGSEVLVNRYGPGELLGEAFHITQVENTVAVIRSSRASEIFFFSLRQILENPKEDNGDPCKQQVFKNYISILAGTNIRLNRKISVITQKTLRDKLLLYLRNLAEETGSTLLCLPFGREQLAQYVNAERSSVCRELSAMQKEGLIAVRGRMIRLLV